MSRGPSAHCRRQPSSAERGVLQEAKGALVVSHIKWVRLGIADRLPCDDVPSGSLEEPTPPRFPEESEFDGVVVAFGRPEEIGHRNTINARFSIRAEFGNL